MVGDFERITLESGQLTIETRRGAQVERHEFQPYWARLQSEERRVGKYTRSSTP